MQQEPFAQTGYLDHTGTERRGGCRLDRAQNEGVTDLHLLQRLALYQVSQTLQVDRQIGQLGHGFSLAPEGSQQKGQTTGAFGTRHSSTMYPCCRCARKSSTFFCRTPRKYSTWPCQARGLIEGSSSIADAIWSAHAVTRSFMVS